ncbi:hypothetical protein G5I_00707 [Acromyrmex echinatior]|uniref:Uncharacterized protein n=1 Tax=Acromyrmex echinatior TaxID=103372 RepID=F4W5L0_ACREC|nr:hypothetical protein G5I_00707 [Acromyrmex echinatior]
MYRSNPDPTSTIGSITCVTVTDNSRSVGFPRNTSWSQRDNSLESRSGDESSVFFSVFLDLQRRAAKQRETAKLWTCIPSRAFTRLRSGGRASWMCSRFLAGGKRMCRGRINGIWRTHEEDGRPSGFGLTYVLDFPTIERLNELNIFVTNAIVFDVQVSGILSIYTKKWGRNGPVSCFSRQRRVFSGASGARPRFMPNDRKRRCALVGGVGPTLPTAEVVVEELAEPKHVQP